LDLVVPFIVRKRATLAASKGPAWKPHHERRHETRDGAAAEQALSARLMGGVDVRLRNVSTRGVLFESPVRMQIGARATLRLRTATTSLLLPGEVVRCRVSATRHGRLRYETALALATECPLAVTTEGVFSAPQGELMTLVNAAVDSITLVEGS
jgi:hypothetical protein